MAEASVWSEDEFSCPICLDLLKDVTTIPCGHSFCMACITDCWDQQDAKGVCTCPQCRQTFNPRPVLGRNTVLADVVDKLKRLGLHSRPAVRCYVGPGDVECDVCSGRKQKAVKSCLTCLASYCETHLRVHNHLNPGTRHKVIDAAGKVEDLICSDHDKLLEVFCRTDQTCICMLCAMDTHRGHDTVSVAAERTEKQPEVGETQRKFQKIIKEKESHLQDLGRAVKTLQCSADVAVENSERIFTEMMDSIEKRCSEVTKLIRDQERADVSHAEELKETLEQEIAELKMKLTELEQFSQSANNIYFLKSFQSLCAFTTSDNPSACSVRTDVLFESVSDSCSKLKEKLQHELHQGLLDITKTGEQITIFRIESEAKQDSLEYSCAQDFGESDSEPELEMESETDLLNLEQSLFRLVPKLEKMDHHSRSWASRSNNRPGSRTENVPPEKWQSAESAAFRVTRASTPDPRPPPYRIDFTSETLQVPTNERMKKPYRNYTQQMRDCMFDASCNQPQDGQSKGSKDENLVDFTDESLKVSTNEATSFQSPAPTPVAGASSGSGSGASRSGDRPEPGAEGGPPEGWQRDERPGAMAMRAPSQDQRPPTDKPGITGHPEAPRQEHHPSTHEDRSSTYMTRSSRQETKSPTREAGYSTHETRSPTYEGRSSTYETRSPTPEGRSSTHEARSSAHYSPWTPRRSQDCLIKLPPLSFSHDHTVLVDVYQFNNTSRKLVPARGGRPLWDANHVKMPYSEENKLTQSKLVVMTETVTRWSAITKQLRNLQRGSFTMSDVGKFIKRYNPQYENSWSFAGLESYVLSSRENQNIFAEVIPKMAKLALGLKDLVPRAIPLLTKFRAQSITLSQYQIACLLANAFFCTFPCRNSTDCDAEFANYPTINFSSLLGNTSDITKEKLQAIFHYFDTVTKETSRPRGLVTFERCRIPDSTLPLWRHRQEVLGKVRVTSEGTIEKEGKGMLQVDFACSMVGGGVLGNGLVQEEILFLMNPELIVARLFTEKLTDNECLKITGAQQYSEYVGYSRDFKWKGPHSEKLPRDGWERLHRKIVAIDALNFKNPKEQYQKHKIRRELNKAFIGFKEEGKPDKLPAIATGNWGCGAFHEDSILKALIQMMAAAVAQRDLVFFTFGDRHLEDAVWDIYTHLRDGKKTVGQIYDFLAAYCHQVAYGEKTNLRRSLKCIL